MKAGFRLMEDVRLATARQMSDCIKRYDFRSVSIKHCYCSVVGAEGAVVKPI